MKPLRSSYFEAIFRRAPKLLDLDLEWSDGEEHHYRSQLSSSFTKGKWSKFDLLWLRLRDACSQGIHDQAPGLTSHRKIWITEASHPLYDAVVGLRHVIDGSVDGVKPTKASLGAAYFCFDEVSDYTGGFPWSETRPTTLVTNNLRRHHQYIQALLLVPEYSTSMVSIPDFFKIEDV